MEIYVKLLNEGTDAWRPVPATEVAADVYLLGTPDGYDSEDEEMEFLPGSQVIVKSRTFSDGETGLIAVEQVEK